MSSPSPISESPAVRSTGRLRRRLTATVLLTALVLPLTAQILPDAPVVNFRLPMFGDDGHPVWDLRGQEGRYVSEERVDLSGVRLLIFDTDQPNRVETEIISPTATLEVLRNLMRGNDTITVNGDNFVITGQRWLWDAEDRRVEIDEDVKITFFEELSNVLAL